MPTTYDWSRKDLPSVVYAPGVPSERRAREKSGRPLGWHAVNRVDRLGEQALYVWKLDLRRDFFPGQLPLPMAARDRLVHVFWNACRAVWASAQPVAGIVDLAEVDRLLASELWTAAQFVVQLQVLKDLPYNTSEAIERLLVQLDSRRVDLEALAEQNARLYEESGSDPSTMPEVVRRALAHAEALHAHRPVQDLNLLTAALREAVQRMKLAEEPAVPPLPSGAGRPSTP
ncbi:hypothetical protein [Kitasatospora sp. NPDC127060]|uniref:hypothetical protein n=1 Tax=Kitasatospora sp. NPDC127060 TaxID=3347121 RepID=UPI0036481DBD